VSAGVIGIEGNVNDRFSSMRYLIECLWPLRETVAGTDVVLDLTKLRYLGPDGAAMICGSVLEARQRRVNVNVQTNAEPNALSAFLQFSGFKQLVLAGEAPETGHPENVTVPLRRFDQSRHGDPEPVVKLVARFEPVSEDLRLSLEISMNECIQNIEDHAHSPIGGVGCARFIKGTSEVRVALVDWGESIFNSLRVRYPDTRDDVHALQRVLFGGYSAKTRRNNLGRGIDNLRSVVTESFGGDLYIISGQGAVDIHGRRPPRYDVLSHRFQGTAVCFTLPVHPRT
jgi:hypothetical protein